MGSLGGNLLGSGTAQAGSRMNYGQQQELNAYQGNNKQPAMVDPNDPGAIASRQQRDAALSAAGAARGGPGSQNYQGMEQGGMMRGGPQGIGGSAVGGMWADVAGQQGRPGGAQDARGQNYQGQEMQDRAADYARVSADYQRDSRMGQAGGSQGVATSRGGGAPPMQFPPQMGPQQGQGMGGPGQDPYGPWGPQMGPNNGSQSQGQGSSSNTAGPYVRTIDNAGPIQKDIQGQPYYADAAQKAYMQQANRSLDPQWQQSGADLESKLTNMGLSRGSEAWNREMENQMRAKNDAYQGATNASILNAGAEGTRMQGMDINQGNFHNQAQNQQWTQNMGQAGLANQGQSLYDQNALGNRQAATGEYNAWSNNQLGNRAQDTNAFQAQNNASYQNRGMTLQEQQQQFNNAQSMQRFPYELQNLAMGGNFPTGNPAMPNVTTPGGGSTGGGGGATVGAGLENRGAAGASLGGALITIGGKIYDKNTGKVVGNAPTGNGVNPNPNSGGPLDDL
jgi:hypothetical protein